jgi:structural maintenance of chromosome 1
MDALKSDVERTTPNLKASDQYDALVEKERAVTEEFEAVREEEKENIDTFEDIKQNRYN